MDRPQEQDLFDGNEDEGDFVHGGDEDAGESRELLFDRVVCALEEALMDVKDEVAGFCRTNCMQFEPGSGEEKLSYMQIFNEYTALIETALEKALAEKVPELGGLEEVEELLKERPDEIAGDVFDVLVGLGNYSEFKDLMLSYREEQEAHMNHHGHHGMGSSSSAAASSSSSSSFSAVMPPPSPIIPEAAAGLPRDGFGGKKSSSSNGEALFLAPTVISLGNGGPAGGGGARGMGGR